EIQEIQVQPMAAVADDQAVEITATETTTVNQTIVNNYINNITNIDNSTTTNNTTTNTQNNVVDNSVNKTQVNVQQNNVQVIEAPTTTTTSGDIITQVILQVGSQLLVNSIGQDTDRFYNPQQDEVFYENLSNGRVRETVTRADGTKVITVRNRNGDILRRSRIDANGRETVLAYF